jgi:Zn-dependent protease with chaperone function
VKFNALILLLVSLFIIPSIFPRPQANKIGRSAKNIAWLKAINKVIKPDAAFEEIQSSFVHPTKHQENFVNGIKARLGIKDSVIVARIPGGDPDARAYSDIGYSSKKKSHLVAVSQIADPTLMTAFTYHEFGHIVHGIEHPESFEEAQDLLSQPAVITDLNHIKRYMSLGKSAFDSSTQIGQYIISVLAQHEGSFWDRSQLDADGRLLAKWSRTEEKRADLYALDNLYKHGNITAILTLFYHFGSTEYVIAEDDHDEHPSDFERALYIAGFLVDKGVDINHQLRRLEN